MPLPGAVCIAMIWQMQSQGLQMNNNGHLSCEIRGPMRSVFAFITLLSIPGLNCIFGLITLDFLEGLWEIYKVNGPAGFNRTNEVAKYGE